MVKSRSVHLINFSGGQLGALKSVTALMCAESNDRLKNRYTTVYKMVEPTHRCCPTGESIKPPYGALIKRQVKVLRYRKGYVRRAWYKVRIKCVT